MAPILIFYASGYRYDLKREKILKTGTLLLEAKDIKDAQLYINDKLYEKPFDEKLFIYNLLPGDYNIRLEKENYYSWEKNLTIQSSLTTFAQDIILFKKNIPLQIVDGPINNFYLSPDEKKIVYSLNTENFLELYALNLENNEETFLYRTVAPDNAIELSWAASSKKVLVKINDTYLVFDIQNQNTSQDIKELLNFEPQDIKWDNSSDNLLYALKQETGTISESMDLPANGNSEIYKIDLLAKTNQSIFSDDQNLINSEFYIENNDIFYIKRENNKDLLYKYNLNFQTNKIIAELNKSENYKFIKSNNNYLGLIDTDNQKIFLIQKVINNPSTNVGLNSGIKELTGKNGLWDKDEKKLLFYDDFEISYFDTETNQETFINRYGQKIVKALWYPTLAQIALLFENNIKILDLNVDNGQRNVIDIVKFDQITNFYLDQKGEIIYFNGKIGKQQGLYQLQIR